MAKLRASPTLLSVMSPVDHNILLHGHLLLPGRCRFPFLSWASSLGVPQGSSPACSFCTVPGGMPSASRASISAAPARLRPPPHTGLPIHLLQFRIPASRPCPNLRTYASPSPESNRFDVFSFPERLEPQHVNLPNPETRTLSSAGLLHAGTTHSVPESRSVCIPSYFMKLSY